MILQTEDRFEIKLQDIRKDARTFEVFSNGKFREFEKANAERPTDTYMRDYVSSMFTTMIAEIKAPLENDASLAKTRLTDLELALQKVKKANSEEFESLYRYNKELKDKILVEKDATDTKFDQFRLNLSQKMDERNKKEETIKRVVNNIERKLMLLEKKMQDTTSSGGGGASLQVPISASVSSMDAPVSFAMPSDKVDVFTERLDSLQKDFKHMKKQVKGLNERTTKEMEYLHRAVDSKAEKEMLLQNQKDFFSKLNEITTRTDL